MSFFTVFGVAGQELIYVNILGIYATLLTNLITIIGI